VFYFDIIFLENFLIYSTSIVVLTTLLSVVKSLAICSNFARTNSVCIPDTIVNMGKNLHGQALASDNN